MRLAAALLLAPLSAFAQSPTPPPEGFPAGPAQWSLGAGWSPGYVSVISSAPTSLGFVSPPVLPAVTASLERRLGERTWLVLGVFGAVGRQRQDVPPGGFGLSQDDATQLFVNAGVRWIVTVPGAPVDVSFLGLLEGGGAGWDQAVVSAGAETQLKTTAWRVGASIGIAIDRELTRGLSLRVATPLLGASYAWTRAEPAGQPPQEGSDFSVAAVIAPRLELRLAF